MHKSEAALLLKPHVDRPDDANVTDSSEFGRIFAPPAEGTCESSLRRLAVGLQVRVKPLSTDVRRGFIDFVAVDRIAKPEVEAFDAEDASAPTGRLQHPICRVR
jgi:hypothetical protein